ncbi:MAG: fibronectin type III domain-containing protein [Thermoplasmata archaeon]|nr:fibronectin type III domain-containing protein [Thermoplasmata archaeon]
MRQRIRRELTAALLVVVLLGSALVVGYSATNPGHPRLKTPGDAGLETAAVTLLGIGQIQSSGTALTRATTNAIPAYSDVVVDVYCQCTTAPTSMGFGGDGAHSFALEGGVTVSSPAMGMWYYETNNVSAVASGSATVFGNMSSGTPKWGWGGEYVSEAATLGFDAVGPGGSSASGSTNISDNVTATQSGDAIIFSAFSEASTATFSTTTAGRCGATTLTGQNVVSGAYTQQAFSRLVSTVGKVPSCVLQSIAGPWLGLSLAIKAAGTPAAPTGLTVGTVTTTTVPLSWTRAPGPILNATVYQATYSAGSCGLFTTAHSVGAVTTYTVTGLTTGEAVCFKVAEWNSTGQGALAATGLVVTAEIPAAPTGLTGTATLTSIAYTWSLPPGGGILNGTLYLQAACSGIWVGHNVASTGATYTATGLTPHATYCARASEWNVTGQSGPSSSLTTSTNIVPGAPTGFQEAAESLHGIYFEWDSPSGGGLLNGTFYSEPSCVGPWTGTPLSSTATNYELAGLSPGELACAYVTAWNSTGQGAPSSTVRAYAASLPLPPRALNGTASETGVNLSWLVPAGGGLVNVTLYEAVACVTPFIGISMDGVQQSFALGGLPPATSVCVYLTAWNESGQSVPSTTVTFTTLDEPAANETSAPPGGILQLIDGLLTVGALLVLGVVAAILVVALVLWSRIRRW